MLVQFSRVRRERERPAHIEAQAKRALYLAGRLDGSPRPHEISSRRVVLLGAARDVLYCSACGPLRLCCADKLAASLRAADSVSPRLGPAIYHERANCWRARQPASRPALLCSRLAGWRSLLARFADAPATLVMSVWLLLHPHHTRAPLGSARPGRTSRKGRRKERQPLGAGRSFAAQVAAERRLLRALRSRASASAPASAASDAPLCA